ncbi:PP2C family protein-serine/threonine phosphatase [Streptomyces sp. NPDC005356]|uniref:PP2C family protein-serine/threonine phosphatase n=1 Tax=Streptomyces sp. NPDC005356 TaxID=3157167 RepID=UPI0033B887D2
MCPPWPAASRRASSATPPRAARSRNASPPVCSRRSVPEDAAVLRLLTCGHPPPLLLSGGTVRELEATAASPPFNLSGLLDDGYHVDVVPFRAGDSLLLYTDGVSEARDRDGVFYPLADRIRPIATAAPRTLIDHLGADLLAYASDELNDDAAVLVVHRTSDGTPARES